MYAIDMHKLAEELVEKGWTPDKNWEEMLSITGSDENLWALIDKLWYRRENEREYMKQYLLELGYLQHVILDNIHSEILSKISKGEDISTISVDIAALFDIERLQELYNHWQEFRKARFEAEIELAEIIEYLKHRNFDGLLHAKHFSRKLCEVREQ